MRFVIIIISMSFCFIASSQELTKKQNWHHLSADKDTVVGISSEKAYKLLSNKKASQVVVAVIDSGSDIYHEDLKNNVWVNKKEIPDNGIDDDNNGYVDDIHGWNFLSSKSGFSVKNDSGELARMYGPLKKKWDNVKPESVSKKDKKEYEEYLKLKQEYTQALEKNKENFRLVDSVFVNIVNIIGKAEEYLGVSDIPLDYLKKASDYISSKNLEGDYFPNFPNLLNTIAMLMEQASYTDTGTLKEELQGNIDYINRKHMYELSLYYDPRWIVSDDYSNLREKGYGSNNYHSVTPEHGTHVAGIIAAEANNGLGMNGIASNVAKIMTLRAVPDGDERDKDIANAIFYAADNGAKIINMSFGKGYSPNYDYVLEAIKYAASKDVLLIHAAGNDNENIDEKSNFPTPKDLGKLRDYWIEVGACSSDKDNLKASFSNYGENTVDIFAPGVDIYSTVADNKYKSNSGTSMAAPVVAGIAAVIRAYYPNLSAKDVKKAIIEGAVLYDNLKGKAKVSGVVNLENSIKYLEKM